MPFAAQDFHVPQQKYTEAFSKAALLLSNVEQVKLSP